MEMIFRSWFSDENTDVFVVGETIPDASHENKEKYTKKQY